MAGSLNHIVSEDGKFQRDLIDNLGDAWEALEDCFNIIYFLSGGDKSVINATAEKAHTVPLSTDIHLS